MLRSRAEASQGPGDRGAKGGRSVVSAR
jgi:hypothetical protein